MITYGDRPTPDAAQALVGRRIAVSDLRHAYAAADLARAELKPIIHITTPLHSRHDRPYGVREWGVFLDGQCIAYVNATRAGQLKLWPYALGENQYQIEGEMP